MAELGARKRTISSDYRCLYAATRSWLWAQTTPVRNMTMPTELSWLHWRTRRSFGHRSHMNGESELIVRAVRAGDRIDFTVEGAGILREA